MCENLGARKIFVQIKNILAALFVIPRDYALEITLK